MSWTSQLLVGLAAYLSGSGVGTWRPNDPYLPADLRPIFIGDLPATPDEVIALAYYDVTDLPGITDLVAGVQIRTRAAGDDTRPVTDLADDIYDVLHGAMHIDLGGVHVSQSWRNSSLPLGQDGNRRWGHSANYYLQTARSTPHTD